MMKKLLLLSMLCTVMGALSSVIQAANYDLYIAGTRVTDDNKADILGNGAFSYESSTKTLLLKGDYELAASSSESVIDNRNIEGLVIDVTKDVTLTSGNSMAIYLGGSSTIKGSGKLTLKNPALSTIYVRYGIGINYANLTLDHVTINSECDAGIYGLSNNYTESLIIDNSSLIISNARFSGIGDLGSLTLIGSKIATPAESYYDKSRRRVVDKDGNAVINLSILPEADLYDLWVGGTQVSAGIKDDILGDGKVSYEPETSTLKLDGATIDVNGTNKIGIKSSVSDLNIVVFGINAINSPSGFGIWVEPGSGTVTFKGGGSLDITSSNAGFSTYANVVLNNVQLSVHNIGDYIGMVGLKLNSDTGPLPTLTLTGSRAELKAFGGRSYGSLGSLTGFSGLSLSDGLYITAPYGATFEPGTGVVKKGSAVVNEWVILGPFVSTDIWVRATQVAGSNKDDVLGDGKVSYDPKTNVLKLKGSPSVPDNSLWDVKLAEKGDAALSVARVVTKWLGLSLSEARTLVNSAPCVLAEQISKERATLFGQALEKTGATVKLVNAKSGVEEDVEDAFDELATEGADIYSNVEDLTIEVSGDYAAYGTTAGIAVDKNTVIKGDGAKLFLNGGTHGLLVGKDASVSIEDGLQLTAVGRTERGIHGESKESCGLYVNDASTNVQAYGGVGGFSFLQLNDGLKVTEPQKYNFYNGYVADSVGDAVYIVTISSPFNPADVNRDGTVDSADIVAVIKEMPDGDKKADVNGDTVIDSADIVAVIKAMK